MNYESVKHGTSDFPIEVHTTRQTDGFSLYPHIHKEFELLVITEGRGKIFIDGIGYDIEKGDGVFINSGALHMGISNSDKPCVFYAIVFAAELFGRFGNDLIMNKYVSPIINGKVIFPAVFRGCSDWQTDILESCRKIAELYRERKACFELRIKEQIFKIWSICMGHARVQNSEPDKGLEIVKKAIEFIQNEYSAPLTLNDISAHVNMSREHFCRKFSSIMHMPPFEYLNFVRIDNSCYLLRESDISIGRISELCGFNSFSYFSKKFKMATGKTPAEYRRCMNYLQYNI